MKRCFFLLAAVLLTAALAACQSAAPVCPSGALTYLDPSSSPLPTSITSAPDGAAGQNLPRVDRVISGYLCNANLSGSVYVACQVQVNRWQDKPFFLDGCTFSVAPGSVIYVAAHNNAAYYNGCAACHMSSAKSP